MDEDQIAKVAGRSIFVGILSGIVRTTVGVMFKGEKFETALDKGFQAGLLGAGTTVASQSVAESLTGVDENAVFAGSVAASVFTGAALTGLLDDDSETKRT